jgi:DNA-binding FadR family transcriptional regulator
MQRHGMSTSIRHDQRVRDYIIGGIRSGAWRANGKLPTERALSEQLGVPRSAVRDALAVLESGGAVTRIIGSGTYVREIEPAPAANDVSADPPASPAEIMQARLLLEPQLAQLAAINADQSDFARFDECIRQGDAADGFEAFELWDAALHQAIAASTHNRLVIELYAMITRARDLTEWGELKRRSLSAERREHYRREHHAIVAALQARDATRAEAALLGHLERVRNNLLGR